MTKFASPLRDERGAALVELALVLPMLMLLILGVIEFGRAWSVRQALVDAAREGARVAAIGNNLTARAALEEQVVTTIRDRVATAQLDLGRLTVDHVGVAAGTSTTVTVTVNYQYVPITGQLILRRPAVPMTTAAVMRNE